MLHMHNSIKAESNIFEVKLMQIISSCRQTQLDVESTEYFCKLIAPLFIIQRELEVKNEQTVAKSFCYMKAVE
ncbi:hypothetical protein T02_14187 [Trichinella nativa]|uniref:Uncharacterized protein n=1 Tax=Trichinella nativa TaxID=6335 RepID=A0A0V1LL84_9BILA|nr:hypothetical protein T06_4176 [Trichinella sp. T6]KRZ60119.1 hypothetical protein T02_14187 [Trichinella nativa]